MVWRRAALQVWAAMTDTLMPAAFLGHGSPMNAIEQNDYTQAWHSFGANALRPRAILVISAHWYINATAVTAMPNPKTIHDFYGFPDELFAVQYAAPGSPEVAEEVADLVKPTWVGLDQDSWGIDHGAWSVLVHAFPAADIPVVQLAINAQKPLDYHLELGSQLEPLRRRGVLILGSGNVVHNLHRIDWSRPAEGFDWAERFDTAARELMVGSPGDVVGLTAQADYPNAVPTPDHFIPLLYVAGVAAAAGTTADVLVDGYTYGSLSMTAYTVGSSAPEPVHGTSSAGAIPDPAIAPADDTNI